MCDIDCDLVMELLSGNNGDLLAHVLVGVEVGTQACIVILNMGHLLDGRTWPILAGPW